MAGPGGGGAGGSPGQRQRLRRSRDADQGECDAGLLLLGRRRRVLDARPSASWDFVLPDFFDFLGDPEFVFACAWLFLIFYILIYLLLM